MFMDDTQIYLQTLDNTCGSISEKLRIGAFHAVPTTNCTDWFSHVFREYRKKTSSIKWFNLVAATETKNQTQK